jgi:hypothetical protein
VKTHSPELLARHADLHLVPTPDPARVAQIAAVLPEHPAWPLPSPLGLNGWRSIVGPAPFAELDRLAEETRRRPLEQIGREHFEDFHRTGLSTAYQAARVPLQERFVVLTAHAGVAPDGASPGALLELLRHYCGLFSWVSPYHDWLGRNYAGERPTVDIVVAEFAQKIARAVAALGPALSPDLQSLILSEMERRVFSVLRPAYAEGKDGSWWLNSESNWNVVCLSGTTLAALTLLPDRHDRALFVAGAELHVEKFLRSFEADGACTEGINYWHFGFGLFIQLAEACHRATGGVVNLWKKDKVSAIARFGARYALTPGVYPAFSDVAHDLTPPHPILAFVSRRFGLGQHDSEAAALASQRFLMEFPASNMDSSEWRAGAVHATTPTQHDWFPDSHIYLGRPGSSRAQLAVALKGGHNNQPHNHNDLGSFVIAVRGRPVVTDMGMPVYDRDYFAEKRYNNPAACSRGHGLPVIDGHYQRAGLDAASRVLRAEFGAVEDTVVLDLTAAYAVPHLCSLTRTFTYSRHGNGSVRIEDRAIFSKPATYASALVTFEPWFLPQANALRLGSPGHQLAVTWESDLPCELSGGVVPVRLSSGQTPPSRWLISLPAALEAKLTFHFSPL